MVGENNQIIFLLNIDALSFAEFEISEFEIARVDCTCRSTSELLKTLVGATYTSVGKCTVLVLSILKK